MNFLRHWCRDQDSNLGYCGHNAVSFLRQVLRRLKVKATRLILKLTIDEGILPEAKRGERRKESSDSTDPLITGFRLFDMVVLCDVISELSVMNAVS